jgi:hypothetical protein
MSLTPCDLLAEPVRLKIRDVDNRCQGALAMVGEGQTVTEMAR